MSNVGYSHLDGDSSKSLRQKRCVAMWWYLPSDRGSVKWFSVILKIKLSTILLPFKPLKDQNAVGPRGKSATDLLPISYQTYLKDKIKTRVLINRLLDSNDGTWTGSPCVF